jgi:hypothetical protein
VVPHAQIAPLVHPQSVVVTVLQQPRKVFACAQLTIGEMPNPPPLDALSVVTAPSLPKPQHLPPLPLPVAHALPAITEMAPHAVLAPVILPQPVVVVTVPQQLTKLVAGAWLTFMEMLQPALPVALLVLEVVLLVPRLQQPPLTQATAHVQRCGMDLLQGPQQEPHARYARHAARILLLV